VKAGGHNDPNGQVVCKLLVCLELVNGVPAYAEDVTGQKHVAVIRTYGLVVLDTQITHEIERQFLPEGVQRFTKNPEINFLIHQ